MDRGLALMLTAIVGGLVAMQAPINGTLGRTIGPVQAAIISFMVGLTALVILATLTSGIGNPGKARELPWYYLIGGGLCGAAYVASVIYTVRTLGAGGVTAATTTGQLTMAVLLDHFGLFGLERTPITLTRLVGVAMLASGVFLIVRR